MTTMNTCTAPNIAVCAVRSAIITRSDRVAAERREAGEPLGGDRRRVELASRALDVLDPDEEEEERRRRR